MAPFHRDLYGNPSGSHVVARAAVRALDEARETIAGIVGARPGEVIFTSGGTEADNQAVAGGMPPRSGVPVCSAVEHHAVLDVVEALGGRTVAVDRSGRVDLDALGNVLGELGGTTSVVSVMLANNEVGVVNDLGPVAELLREFALDDQPIPLHTDAVQAAAWLDLREAAASADMISLSAHKLGGPKGVGALIVREPHTIRPLILGGGQERGRRSGTPGVGAIVGFATALAALERDRERINSHVAALRERFVAGLLESLEDVTITVADAPVLPGTCHVCFGGADSEALLLLFEAAGVVASAGSSCSSGATESSHVLRAMGVPEVLGRGAIRFSFGHDNDMADIDQALAVIPGAVERAREFCS